MYIYDDIWLSSSQNEKYFKQQLQRKSKPHFKFQNFFSDDGGGGLVQPERPQKTKWCLRIACWVIKGVHTRTALYLLPFQNNNRHQNTPPFGIIRILPFQLRIPLQIPFTCAAFSVPPSRWPLCPSCPLLLFFLSSLPFIFGPCG